MAAKSAPASASLKPELVMRRSVVVSIDHAATGTAFRAKRMASNLTLRALAREMDVSASYVSDLERGKRPWSDKLVFRYDSALLRATSSKTKRGDE